MTLSFEVSKERAVIVTGGVEGIGRSIAESFLKNGNRVAVIDKNGEAGQRMKEEFKGLGFFEADLSKPDLCKDLVSMVREELGRIDILVNNAGFQHVAPFEEFPDDVSEAMFNLMLRTPFQLSKYTIPAMKEHHWGRIINIASIHGMVASPLKAAYVTVKHGLVGLTRAIALESISYGITCNAIAPTFVRTALVTNQIKSQAEYMHVEESRVVSDVLMKDSPLKRLLEPEEVASLAMYLSTDAASGINGAVVPIDHGYTAR